MTASDDGGRVNPGSVHDLRRGTVRTVGAGKVPKVEIYEAGDGWRWRLKAANGRILAVSSEAYSSCRAAERGWDTSRQAAADCRTVEGV